MTSDSTAYLAGIGFSPSQRGDNGVGSIISAVTKALLDAGITYHDVTRGVGSKAVLEAFKAFGDGISAIDESKQGSELEKAVSLVSDSKARCVLVIATDQSSTVALVLASNVFLWSRPYLKDSSAVIKDSISQSTGRLDQSLLDLCQIVWRLRGWSDRGKTDSLYGGFQLSRVDSQDPPKWKDVEHKPDGKYRLGYNPAKIRKEISQEDFDYVRATGKGGREGQGKTLFKHRGGDRATLEAKL